MDKFVVVSGASSGIGKAISICLSTYGYKCILLGRNIIRLKSTLSEMEGDGHIIFDGDINDEEFLFKVSDQVPDCIGVVHSAGIIKLVPYKFINKIDFIEILNTNLLSPFFLTQLLLKKKKILNGGSIVFVSSISGTVIGSKGNIMYSSSKSGLDGIVKSLSLELSDKRIRVNSINAGMVETEMWNSDNSSVSSTCLDLDSKKYPLGYGKPIDIANLTRFLISEESVWITGSNIIADGGFSIQ